MAKNTDNKKDLTSKKKEEKIVTEDVELVMNEVVNDEVVLEDIPAENEITEESKQPVVISKETGEVTKVEEKPILEEKKVEPVKQDERFTRRMAGYAWNGVWEG
jgi:hypothetical protein